MRKLFILLLVFYFSQQLHAQETDRRKVLSIFGNVFQFTAAKNETASSSYSSTGFGISPNILYGVKKGNKLLSYGANLIFSYDFPSDSSASSTEWGIAPAISYQYFIPVGSNFFVTPFLIGKVGYKRKQIGKTSIAPHQIVDEIFSAIEFSPFSISFQKSKSMMILFTLGAASLDFSTAKALNKNSVPGDYLRATNLTIFVRPTISFGILKMF